MRPGSGGHARRGCASLNAGFATADLTPRPGGDLNGFIDREQPSLGVATPLTGRVLVLRSGRKVCVLVVCDLLGFTLEDSRRIGRAVGLAAGFPVASVVLICTHNHSGPMSMPLGTVGRHDPSYVRRCEKALAAAARRAMRDLDAVTGMDVARGRAPHLGQLRIPAAQRGSAAWPGDLAVLRLVRRERAPVVVLHYGVHACVLGPRNRHVHPDYPGLVCTRIEAATGAHALFLPGAGADVNPRPGLSASRAVATRYARALAATALRALAASRRVPHAPVAMRALTCRVNLGWLGSGGGIPPRFPPGTSPRLASSPVVWARAWRAGRLPAVMRLPIRLLRLGDVTLALIPTEVFWETASDLERSLRSRRRLLLTVSQAGGDVGYLCRPHAYRHNTYEAANAYQWYGTAGSFQPDTEARLRARLVAALRLLVRPAAREAILRP